MIREKQRVNVEPDQPNVQTNIGNQNGIHIIAIGKIEMDQIEPGKSGSNNDSAQRRTTLTTSNQLDIPTTSYTSSPTRKSSKGMKPEYNPNIASDISHEKSLKYVTTMKEPMDQTNDCNARELSHVLEEHKQVDPAQRRVEIRVTQSKDSVLQKRNGTRKQQKFLKGALQTVKLILIFSGTFLAMQLFPFFIRFALSLFGVEYKNVPDGNVPFLTVLMGWLDLFYGSFYPFINPLMLMRLDKDYRHFRKYALCR